MIHPQLAQSRKSVYQTAVLISILNKTPIYPENTTLNTKTNLFKDNSLHILINYELKKSTNALCKDLSQIK